ncbi:PD-(D/E)XK nuclease family protein [Pseudolabrys taiwanensis]|uniref:PD-(D/E)XK nuclease family protein n=1 Tax=Pseudolabrys taiwanensis TaxID=331696 RepID=A0A345ZRJ5_9HYPH|nr:PD-(D/E)XK nuclease family protein [Pseudolabrys taiwanensis]AXK79542.1 PD-(D/E)XK nuclease family protein [Pseudolabrys taiwanensis]
MPQQLNLVFGWWADGITWPEMPGTADAYLGETVVGPAGLLDVLETALGTGAPPQSHACRIAEWQAKMRAADDGARVWSQSYKIDPWGTARLVLGWRDELVEAGWTPDVVGSPRLKDIAAIENAAPMLSPGVSDRLQALIDAIKGRSIPLHAIRLIDARNTLPTGWRLLLDTLEARGVRIEAVPQIADNASGDLKVLRTPGKTNALSGDGSVFVLFANTEIVAAECLASWLAAAQDNQETIVVAGRPTGLLDSFLADRGLPRIGDSDRSPFRGAIQVLSLAFATSWLPFDPRPLIDLLLLPRPPFPRRIAREFARTLSERPGQGHSGWNEAWKFAAHWLEDHRDADDNDDAASRLQEWRDWIEPTLFPAEPGMPSDAAARICARVQQWAYKLDRGNADPVLTKVAQLSGELAQAISAIGLAELPRHLLERMIDQVVMEGMENPIAAAEASEWTAVAHPGAVWGPARRLIWWGFEQPEALPKAGPWDEAERAILKSAGCPIDDIDVALERHSISWRRAIQAPQQELILVRTRGSDNGVHPVWHELSAKFDNASVNVIGSAEDILEGRNPRVAFRLLARTAVAIEALPPKRRCWHMPNGVIKPEATSPSAIEDLLSCPLRWTLSRLLRIRRGALQGLPREEQLLGNLAHEIARAVFVTGDAPERDDARRLAEQLFGKLVSEIAAPLALPGYAALYEEARQQIPHAIGELAGQLRQSGLTIEGCEIELAKELPDGTLMNGRIDLLARDSQKRPVIFDLKWARREKLYRQKLESGEAVQLAAYSYLTTDVPSGAPAGYFLIRQSALLGSSDSPFAPQVRVQGPDMAATWQNVTAAWQSRMEAISAGRAVALGVPLGEGEQDVDQAPSLSLQPPCHYCEYHGLCGGSREEA